MTLSGRMAQRGTPDLLREYHQLLDRFGSQGWWPLYREVRSSGLGVRVIVQRPSPKRLTEQDRFQICIGALLTQNTAWTNVERALANVLATGPCTPERMTEIRRDRLARLIHPAGYYRQKARKLSEFSSWLLERYRGSLAQFFRHPTNRCRSELLDRWGIGPETADSMLLYAGQHPVFVIDAYTMRWCASRHIIRRTYDAYQQYFMDHLPRRVRLFNEFHALLVAWGKAERGTVATPAILATFDR